jgi:hypothetical protein
MADPPPSDAFMKALMAHTLGLPSRDDGLSKPWQAIVDNTRGDLFWIGEILLNELEKETGFRGKP